MGTGTKLLCAPFPPNGWPSDSKAAGLRRCGHHYLWIRKSVCPGRSETDSQSRNPMTHSSAGSACRRRLQTAHALFESSGSNVPGVRDCCGRAYCFEVCNGSTVQVPSFFWSHLGKRDVQHMLSQSYLCVGKDPLWFPFFTAFKVLPSQLVCSIFRWPHALENRQVAFTRCG